MYICGPTVYDRPHLGHGRSVLVFDVLRRYLTFCGFKVRHVSNITDVDDHIIERSSVEGTSEAEVAGRYEAMWWSAMDALGVWRPDHVPHATSYITQMVDLVGRLVAAGCAYQTSDGVYLSVERVPGYGLLAHQPLESLRSGARVASTEEKRSPLDFALWKKAKPGEPRWPSPWGEGRPGWHTECVVMSLDLLGEGFDLHGGGRDLAFPHHENERAQAVALGMDFARHWSHNGWVTVEGEKMSKSLGNFTTLEDLLDRHDPRAYRLIVLGARYRSPIEVTPETMAQAEEGLERLDAMARRFSLGDPLAEGPVRRPAEADGVLAEAVGAFTEVMDDDLDTPAAVAGIFDLLRQANAADDEGRADEGRQRAEAVALLCGALGLPLRSRVRELDDATRSLVAERDAARRSRDFATADRLRDELRRRGWIVEDGPKGTVLRR